MSVVGPLCTPLDLLADQMELAKADVGDLVVVFQSGAYGLTASPAAFLSHPVRARSAGLTTTQRTTKITNAVICRSAAMSGLCGWIGNGASAADNRALIEAMAAPLARFDGSPVQTLQGRSSAVAVAAAAGSAHAVPARTA